MNFIEVTKAVDGALYPTTINAHWVVECVPSSNGERCKLLFMNGHQFEVLTPYKRMRELLNQPVKITGTVLT